MKNFYEMVELDNDQHVQEKQNVIIQEETRVIKKPNLFAYSMSKFLYLLLLFLQISTFIVILFVLIVQPVTTLPNKLIVGYAYWQQCDESIIKAAKDGVNVIVWFAIDLVVANNRTFIAGGPDFKCVSKIAKKLRTLKLDTKHLISVGGWDSIHPDISKSAEEYYETWKEWNTNIINDTENGFYGFDGIDWDIEGNDDINSKYNKFSVELLDLIGKFSLLAKADGYIVSLAPAESYMDPTTSAFDMNLTHNYPEWEKIVPNFLYHGHNPYSYLISKYENEEGPNVFDFISIQIYEGYSHALFNMTILHQNFTEYLETYVKKLYNGWFVDFSSEKNANLTSRKVNIKKNQLVIGLANGWVSKKFLLVYPEEIKKAYLNLVRKNLDPRGFMFWNMADEGRIPENDTNPLWLAKSLNKFLNIRKNIK